MGDKASEPPKKMKFAPKIPPRRIQRAAEAKREAPDDEDALNEELLKRVKENFGRSRRKDEKKLATEQIPSFGPSAATAHTRTYARTFGNPGEMTSSKHQDGGNESMAQKMEKEYVEPWDYYSYYPTVLPLRRPHSGNPEILDEKEFGEASANVAQDESRVNPAEELGLMEEGKNPEMIFFQLPASLPLVKRSASAKGEGEDKDNGSKPATRTGSLENGRRLEELPAGFMGKMLVYKSGAIKMKLGDHLFDVSSGMECVFAQDIAAINPVDKHCCILGELNKRAIVTPDIDSLLDGIAKLE